MGERHRRAAPPPSVVTIAAIAVGLTALAAIGGAAPKQASPSTDLISRSGTTLNSLSYIAQHVWSPEFEAYCSSSSPSGCASTKNSDPGRFPLVVAQPGFYSKHEVAHLRAENPTIILLVYINGIMRMTGDNGPNGNNTGTYPDCAPGTYSCSYAYTAPTGSHPHSKIKALPFPGSLLMNPVDSTWIDSRAAKCAYDMSRSGINGCFFDTVGEAPVASGYVGPGLPYDAQTGSAWTASNWLNAMNNLLSTVGRKDPSALVYGNGLLNGQAYFAPGAPTSRLYKSLDGALAEKFLMNPTPNAKNMASWLQDVNMLADAGRQKHTILTTTNAWTAGSSAQKDSWHMFALASFLLGSSPYSYFNFQFDHTRAAPTTWNNEWNADIGEPMAAYSQTGSLYERRFTGGIVLVNPSNKLVDTHLGPGLVALDGTPLQSVVPIGPQSAVIAVAPPSTTSAPATPKAPLPKAPGTPGNLPSTPSSPSTPATPGLNVSGLNPVPQLQSLTPAIVAQSGGTLVTLVGHHLTGVSMITLGAVSVRAGPCPPHPTSPCFTVLDDSHVQVVTPPLDAGVVPVVAVGPGGTSNPATFLVTPAVPASSNITPAGARVGSLAALLMVRRRFLP